MDWRTQKRSYNSELNAIWREATLSNEENRVVRRRSGTSCKTPVFSSRLVMLWVLQRRVSEVPVVRHVRIIPTGAAELRQKMVSLGSEVQACEPIRRKCVLCWERRMVWTGMRCGWLGAWGRPLHGNKV